MTFPACRISPFKRGICTFQTQAKQFEKKKGEKKILQPPTPPRFARCAYLTHFSLMHALYVHALASDGARSFGLSSVAKTLLCLEDLLAVARWSSKPKRALPRSPSNRHRSIKNFFWALHSKKAWSAVRLTLSTDPPYFHALDPVVCLSLATFTGDTLLAGHTDPNLGLGVDSNTVFIQIYSPWTDQLFHGSHT